MDIETRRQAEVASIGWVGSKHSRPNVYDPLLTKSLARTWTMYVPVSGSVSCCWLLALKVTTTAPVGEKTVAVAVTNTGKPLPVNVSVTLLLARPLKVI